MSVRSGMISLGFTDSRTGSYQSKVIQDKREKLQNSGSLLPVDCFFREICHIMLVRRYGIGACNTWLQRMRDGICSTGLQDCKMTNVIHAGGAESRFLKY